ncbi:unnamed protein product [Boreogadus saida]
MPLYSDISGTETGKCTDCTKLQQTVALFETRLAALEKCKGLLQDTVPMESTNAPATHAPLSPEMRLDGQCGQRRNMNQSPWRRAAHASATCAPLTPEMCPDRRPKILKRDNSLPDTMDTVPSPIADAGLARNGHPPPHLSHRHNNNSSSTVSSLCDFPAEFKKLEYVGIKLASVSMIASPGHGHRLITPKRRAPQPPPPCTDSSPEYY